MNRTVMIAVALAALASIQPARSVAQTRDWDWKGQIKRGDIIEIRGVNGSVRAERTSGDEVEVVARLRAEDDDPNEIRMEVVQHSGGVTICALYPDTDEDRPNECQLRGRGRNNVKHNDVNVDFTVRVPAGVRFSGWTVNGGVEARNIDGDVVAHAVNGDIDVSSSGLVKASTVNGSITASMGRSDWDGVLDFSTVNGSVTLEFPEDLNCEMRVSTVNGSISSDFNITVKGKFSPRSLKGTIGSGGRDLVVKTVNGSIHIRRS